jgi:hypothetical protein
MPEVKCIAVSLSRIHAVIAVDTYHRRATTLYCTNCDFCRNINILNSDGRCPGYCELIVAAKDCAFARRKAKANVQELDPENCEYYILKLEKSKRSHMGIFPLT